MIRTDSRSLSDEDDDYILCREAVSGNAVAFSRLVSRYRKRLFGLGYSFFRNGDDAEDFVQDVLVKLYVSLASFRGESRFTTWMMRIAYNTAINSVKRRKEYTSLAEDFDVADSAETPEESLIRDSSCKAIRAAIEELPEKYRVCVDMFFFYDMSHNEISEVTGLPINTIKSHIFRAKKILRQTLDEGDNNEV